MATVKPTLTEMRSGIQLVTGELHTIVLERTTVDVRILDSAGAPVPNLLCQLTLPGEAPRPEVTDADGWIHADVSPAKGDIQLNIPQVDTAVIASASP